MRRLVLATLATLSLGACATPAPTVYQPAAGPQAVGYSEYRIEPGRYRVTFQGGPGAPAQRVEDLALLRAADLALAQGYDWFRVADRSFQGRPDRGPYIGLGVGGASFGHHSAVGLGVSNGFSLGGGPSVTTTLEVVMGKGPRPGGVNVYDARALRENLGQRT
jgi:hypothetical protein